MKENAIRTELAIRFIRNDLSIVYGFVDPHEIELAAKKFNVSFIKLDNILNAKLSTKREGVKRRELAQN